MRRWAGWGEESSEYPLDRHARTFLESLIGSSEAAPEPDLDACLATVPDSRLQDQVGLDSGAELRLRRSRGESFPDWLARKFGAFGPFPDAVARPRDEPALRDLITAAQKGGWSLIPFAGGTSVVGHLAVPAQGPPVVSVDMGGLTGLRELDEKCGLARFGAGTPGPALEQALEARGLRLGHYPQSFEYSTVGGWVVTRSSGQQSLLYGRIEQLFAGGRLLAPRGDLEIPCLPASSAGPDLRELILGSEARLGILSEAVVRVRPLPEIERVEAVMFPDWSSALSAVRAIAQARPGVAMLRLSNAVETTTQLALAGHRVALGALQRYLSLRGVADGQCLLLVGLVGRRAQIRRTWQDCRGLLRAQAGIYAGPWIGQGWAKNRFRGPYLRNVLWQAGYGADTIETAVNWDRVDDLVRAMEEAARQAFAEDNERVHAFTHLSHVYPQGSSIYSTFVFRATADHEQMMERWRRFKARVSQEIVRLGGTISHQHGVGIDHKAYLEAEKSGLGLDLIRATARELDPGGIMNPGKLFDV